MDLTERVGHRLKLRDLRLLLAVAELGSMARAANHLNLTQSAVSRAIGELEHTMGVRLFDRTPLGVESTIYGRALLKGCVAVFDDLRTSISEIEFLSDATAGELLIGTTESSMGGGLLPTLVDRLARHRPRLSTQVIIADPVTLRERDLRGRRVELALMRTATLEPNEDFQETVLFDDRLHIVAGVANPWAARRKITIADLVNERWCLPPLGHPVRTLLVDAFRRNGLQPPQASVTVGSHEFTRNLVAKGQFLGILGTGVLRFYARHSSLKVLPVRLSIPASPVSIVTLRNRTLSPLAELFIKTALAVSRPAMKSK